MANTNFLEQLCNLLAKLGTLYPHTPAQLAALHRAYNRIQMKICVAQEKKKNVFSNLRTTSLVNARKAIDSEPVAGYNEY